GITSPRHLGAMGGSNGGLLAGNMLTQYPELFGAIVIQVPLLDMKRYSHLLAGASWMAEYGYPDTADWEFIKDFSAYHLFDPAKDYPPTFIWTTTRDDRVHPGHARKMAAKMLDAGKDVRYYENTEGGHGAGATNAQSAHVWALTYRFLWDKLAAKDPAMTDTTAPITPPDVAQPVVLVLALGAEWRLDDVRLARDVGGRDGGGGIGHRGVLRGQLVPEEAVGQRPHVRALRIGGAGTVAAFGVLVVADVLAGVEHLRRHLARMARMHAVVAGGGPDEGRRIILRRIEQVVGR